MHKQVICSLCGRYWDVQFVEDGVCEACRAEKCNGCGPIKWESEEVRQQVCEECKRPECHICGAEVEDKEYRLCDKCYEEINDAEGAPK